MKSSKNDKKKLTENGKSDRDLATAKSRDMRDVEERRNSSKIMQSPISTGQICECQGPSKSADSGNRDWNEWNPMEGMAKSLLNTTDMEATTVQALLTGVGNMKLEDVLCPFNDGTGRCYKVSCNFKHVPYSSKVLNGLPKLHAAIQSKKQPLLTVSCLPVQLLPATGCISKVVVTVAFDPGNFYVMPEKGWQCLCHTYEQHFDNSTNEENGAHIPRNSTFYDILSELQTRLTKFEQLSKFDKISEFLKDELVAVKLPSNDGRKTWYRARVLSDAVAVDCDDDDDLFKPVDVEIELLDYGLSCIKSSIDIVRLPVEFTNVCQMAYKCHLYGISPLMGTWSNSSIKRFKELVQGQNLLAEVVRTTTPSTFLTNGEENKGCSVKLYIKSQNNKYINAAQDLIDAGFGIKWSL